MITTYQFARKELQKDQQQIRQTENRQKCIYGLKDTVNGINKTYHKTSQQPNCYIGLCILIVT